MIKKIVTGILSIMVVGVLVWGGVNRTIAKLDTAVNSNSGFGKDHEESYRVNQESASYSRESTARGSGNRQERGNETGCDVDALPGVATSVDLGEMVVFSIEQQTDVVLEGRALSYAVENGLKIQPDDAVTLEGFFEDEDFEIIRIINHTGGQTLDLREPSGRPLWAGAGGRAW